MAIRSSPFRRVLPLLCSFAVLTAGVIPWSCSTGNSAGSVDPVTVAWSPFELQLLPWIAEDQGFYGRNGLNVTLRKYDTGVGSLDGMLNGETDVAAGITEFPMVGSALKKSKARIIGAIAKIEQQYLVARKDRGIAKAADLKGKRVGTTFRTIAEFYLGRYLELSSLRREDITVVDLRTPAEWENAVADGVVDAIVTAQPYADLAARRLGGNAVVLPVQGGQYIFGLVVASENWMTGRGNVAGKLLKALARAEEYAIRKPEESKAIMQKRLNVDAAFVESAWLRDQFSLSLDQSLVAAMEDEARWMIKNRLTPEEAVPNFNDYIHTDALKAIKPDAVSIIR